VAPCLQLKARGESSSRGRRTASTNDRCGLVSVSLMPKAQRQQTSPLARADESISDITSGKVQQSEAAYSQTCNQLPAYNSSRPNMPRSCIPAHATVRPTSTTPLHQKHAIRRNPHRRNSTPETMEDTCHISMISKVFSCHSFVSLRMLS
jgi:hypothetical protein